MKFLIYEFLDKHSLILKTQKQEILTKNSKTTINTTFNKINNFFVVFVETF